MTVFGWIKTLITRSALREHRDEDLIDVWHVRDFGPRPSFEPYFVSRCECGWVGDAYDDSDPAARDHAFADARAHGPNVSAEVSSPLA
jgi:hypothetical protein